MAKEDEVIDLSEQIVPKELYDIQVEHADRLEALIIQLCKAMSDIGHTHLDKLQELRCDQIRAVSDLGKKSHGH